MDDAEPPPKKTEVDISNSEGPKKKADTNGRRKYINQPEGDRDKHKDQKKQKGTEKQIVQRFDSEAKGNTVSAFKESDSWD